MRRPPTEAALYSARLLQSFETRREIQAVMSCQSNTVECWHCYPSFRCIASVLAESLLSHGTVSVDFDKPSAGVQSLRERLRIQDVPCNHAARDRNFEHGVQCTGHSGDPSSVPG